MNEELEKEVREIESFAKQHKLQYEDVEAFAFIIAAINVGIERKRIERNLDNNFITFVRPHADVVDWLARDHNGDYHILQEVRATEATAIEKGKDV